MDEASMMAQAHQHQYFLRLDRKTIVKSQAEFDRCQEEHVPLKVVGYNSAVDHLRKEEAAQRARVKKRKASKLARKNRKMNARNR